MPWLLIFASLSKSSKINRSAQSFSCQTALIKPPNFLTHLFSLESRGSRGALGSLYPQIALREREFSFSLEKTFKIPSFSWNAPFFSQLRFFGTACKPQGRRVPFFPSALIGRDFIHFHFIFSHLYLLLSLKKKKKSRLLAFKLNKWHKKNISF